MSLPLNIFLLITITAIIEGCKHPKCGTQTFQVGVDIENNTASTIKLELAPKTSTPFIEEGESDLRYGTPASTYEISLTADETGFRELWQEERSIPMIARGKLSPGKCGDKSDDPRDTTLFAFADADLDRFTICRNSTFNKFRILEKGQACPTELSLMTKEANGPAELKGEEVSKVLAQECTIEDVEVNEWNSDKFAIYREDKRLIAGTFGFNCDYRNWYPTLRCADADFPPRLSTHGAFANCADSNGNLRKSDPFTGSYDWDEVFCLPENENTWITLTSEARSSTHYLFCSRPDVKYPWPWQISTKSTPYRSCATGQKAIFGKTLNDFDCE